MVGLALLVGIGAVLWVRRSDSVPTSLTNLDTSTSQPTAAARFETPAPLPNDYVGSVSCAACHQEINDRYQTHPMSHSMQPLVNAAQADEKWPYPQPPHAGEFQTSGMYEYRVEQDSEGHVLHREIARDAEGVIFEHAEPVAYRIGSGIRGYSYVIDHNGLLMMSPISRFNSQDGEKWDLSPGYAVKNQHFSRRVSDSCWNCHVGRPNPSPERIKQFQSPPYTEAAIGCERCHGPGGRHVAVEKLRAEGKTQQPETSRLPTREIVNPAKLSPTQRDSVCNQCHFLGTERILRYGRSEFDFRPGMEFSDIWTIFLKEASSRETRAVSQTEQMYSSTCWQKSAGKLSCTSCHDPHGQPAAPQEHYRQRCLSCHGPSDTTCSVPVAERVQQSQGDSCIHCHMPAFDAKDVAHASQTDHRILRKPSAPSTSSDNAKLVRFQGPGSEISDADLRRAEGLLIARTIEQSDSRSIDRGIELLLPLKYAGDKDLPVWESLGLFYDRQGRGPQALVEWEEILKVQPQHENALRGLASVERVRDLQKSLEDCQRLRAVNPYELSVAERHMALLEQSGQLSQSIALAQDVLKLDPGNWQIHRWLALAYERDHRPAEAKRHRKLSKQLRW